MIGDIEKKVFTKYAGFGVNTWDGYNKEWMRAKDNRYDGVKEKEKGAENLCEIRYHWIILYVA